MLSLSLSLGHEEVTGLRLVVVRAAGAYAVSGQRAHHLSGTR